MYSREKKIILKNRDMNVKIFFISSNFPLKYQRKKTERFFMSERSHQSCLHYSFLPLELADINAFPRIYKKSNLQMRPVPNEIHEVELNPGKISFKSIKTSKRHISFYIFVCLVFYCCSVIRLERVVKLSSKFILNFLLYCYNFNFPNISPKVIFSLLKVFSILFSENHPYLS